MSDTNNNDSNGSFFSRVFSNDAARKGIAGAVAGLLVATVMELAWPSSEK